MANVPEKFNLTISDGTNTYGYMLYAGYTGGDSSNVPQKAIHSFSPVFVPRTNVQGNFGDDLEDFFLTVSQKDWHLGEQQRHAQNEGSTTAQKYWRGSNVDVTIPGRVTIRPASDNISFSAAADTMTYFPEDDTIVAVEGATLYSFDGDGNETSEGSHGLGDTAARWGSCSDGANVFITSEEASSVGVRKWTGSAFSTFSSTGSSACIYHNNALYGLQKGGKLIRYSTSGTISTIKTWQDGSGTARPIGTTGRLASLGGKLLILLPDGLSSPQLWIYDGVEPVLLHEFPNNFTPFDMEVVDGVVFVSGWFTVGSTYRQAIYYYANGQVGKLWQADEYGEDGQNGPAMTAFGETLAFTNSAQNKIMSYEPSSGGISSLTTYSADSSREAMMGATSSFILTTHGGGSGFQTPNLVQVGSDHNFYATNVECAWPNSTTDGNILFMVVSGWQVGSAPTFTTPTGWEVEKTVAANSIRTTLFRATASTSRSGIENCDFGSETTYAEMHLLEYSGVSVEDQDQDASSSGDSTTASTGTTSSTTADNQLWLAVLANRTDAGPTIAGGQSSPTNSFGLVSTNGSPQNPPTYINAYHRSYVYDRNVTASAAASMSATIAGSGDKWVGLIATYDARAIGDGFIFPASSKATAGTITSSLFDYDNSLSKLFRGLKVDFDSADDGDGGSVDISYVLNDVDAGFVIAQESATSGTEYNLGSPGAEITGRSIAYRITLNKGTSTDGPTLKRVYLRSAPQKPQRQRSLFHIDCTAPLDGSVVTEDNTGQALPRSGSTQVSELQSLQSAGGLVTVTDPFGTYTGYIDQLDVTQIAANDDPGYVVSLIVREV